MGEIQQGMSPTTRHEKRTSAELRGWDTLDGLIERPEQSLLLCIPRCTTDHRDLVAIVTVAVCLPGFLERVKALVGPADPLYSTFKIQPFVSIGSALDPKRKRYDSPG